MENGYLIDFHTYFHQVIKSLITIGPKVIVTIILALIALKMARVLSRRLLKAFIKTGPEEEMHKRVKTLNSLINYVMSAIIISVVAIMILSEVGIEIGPILAAAGVAGVAIGFGAQSLVKDVISGFFILVEDQIRIGDVVDIAGKNGLVEKVNLRMTILRDVAGNVHYVRNGEINVVTNMTKDFSRYVFDIGVSYREDVDEVIKVIQEVDEELRNDPNYKEMIIHPIEVFGLDQFADSAVIIRARTTTKPQKQWRIGREFNRRLKKKFDEKHIEIPFPHLTLYMGEDKEGKAPPLRVFLHSDKGTDSI
jgi:small-conductance mechanosensitive channel